MYDVTTYNHDLRTSTKKRLEVTSKSFLIKSSTKSKSFYITVSPYIYKIYVLKNAPS